ncbi:hypothetical protein SUNI508_06931 [Seiridium unicorne]|uniref:Uncharacterized protein n=1 Tax=Seiridium unicorne TaxID=138068 RepID=A0ABR2V0C7_9PEZI
MKSLKDPRYLRRAELYYISYTSAKLVICAVPVSSNNRTAATQRNGTSEGRIDKSRGSGAGATKRGSDKDRNVSSSTFNDPAGGSDAAGVRSDDGDGKLVHGTSDTPVLPEDADLAVIGAQFDKHQVDSSAIDWSLVD